ncbi:hypothetical protein MKW92_031005 [Papaver armeniacum]|nr:hypothetical protein MKW92_031005 [Papaver armeniacum]
MRMEKFIIPCFVLLGWIMVGMVNNPFPINATVGYNDLHAALLRNGFYLVTTDPTPPTPVTTIS